MKKLAVIVCCFCLSTLAQANELWHLLPSHWKFHQTSNYSLHYTAIKSDQWQSVQAAKLLNTNPKNGIYGWYKIDFDWQHPTNTLLLLYLQRIRHADETWLNGQKIGGLGRITPQWELLASNPHNLARKYHIPPNLLKARNNTLAIKINVGIGKVWGAMLPGGVGLGSKHIGIGSKATVNARYTKQILHNSIIDTVLIVLGLVDVFLIVFLFRRSIHHFHEFRWLLIGSIVMMCSALLLDYFYVLGLTFNGSTVLLLWSLLSSPFVSAMYFWSIHKNAPKKLVLGVAIFWFIVVAAMTLPTAANSTKNALWLVWSALTITLLAYCLFCAISGVYKNFVGARFQLFGLVVFILSIRTQWLPVDLFAHRNIIVGSLILRYSFLFSYFQRINQMSQDYKQLSARMLSAIENHKQDIARDLHDDLGQHLSAAKLRLLLYYQGDVKESIEFIKQEINASLQSVRELMQGLHPLILEQYPFAQALRCESERLAKLHQVTINLDITEVTLNKATEKNLFRIFQEILHNAIKHGKASNIHVELRVEKHRIRLQVSDNGVGFNPQETAQPQLHRGFGLVSLRERIALLDGRIRTQSQVHQGCTVVVSIPNLPE